MNDYYTATPNHIEVPCPPHPALEGVAKMLEERRTLIEKLNQYNRQIDELRKMMEDL